MYDQHDVTYQVSDSEKNVDILPLSCIECPNNVYKVFHHILFIDYFDESFTTKVNTVRNRNEVLITSYLFLEGWEDEFVFDCPSLVINSGWLHFKKR